MRDPSLLDLSGHRRPWDYQVELAVGARLTARGLVHRTGGDARMLGWDEVIRALAAEVGEPEGVRTVVFDLLVGEREGPEGHVYTVLRLDAEPGEDAMQLARDLAANLGAGVAAPSIKSLAVEGTASARYPDLDELEAVAVQLFSGD